jgi:hypothetical protein
VRSRRTSMPPRAPAALVFDAERSPRSAARRSARWRWAAGARWTKTGAHGPSTDHVAYGSSRASDGRRRLLGVRAPRLNCKFVDYRAGARGKRAGSGDGSVGVAREWRMEREWHIRCPGQAPDCAPRRCP